MKRRVTDDVYFHYLVQSHKQSHKQLLGIDMSKVGYLIMVLIFLKIPLSSHVFDHSLYVQRIPIYMF